MREVWHPPVDEITLAGVMHALSDPARLHILSRIARAEDGEPCSDLAEDIALHKSTVSHHYRVLREAGLTRTDIEGRSRVVRLRQDDLDKRFPGLLPAVLAVIDV
jgi:DNA-binding transcriptional ArsR family regulator